MKETTKYWKGGGQGINKVIEEAQRDVTSTTKGAWREVLSNRGMWW